MINIYKKWQHNQLLKRITPVFHEKKYILGDFFHEGNWCVALFIGNHLLFFRKQMHHKYFDDKGTHQISKDFHLQHHLPDFETIFISQDNLVDYQFWNSHSHKTFFKALETKIHHNHKNNIFLINSTEHVLEDISNFISNRSFQTQINCLEIFSLLEHLLSHKYSYLYSPQRNVEFKGNSFD